MAKTARKKAQNDAKENGTSPEVKADKSKQVVKAVNRPLLQLNKGMLSITVISGKNMRKNSSIFLPCFSAGGIVKSKRPVSSATKEANKKARLALATGELSQDELKRKQERDLRTLYIRFRTAESAPKTEAELRKLHKSVADVRIPRQGR